MRKRKLLLGHKYGNNNSEEKNSRYITDVTFSQIKMMYYNTLQV
jgi:hypothetical protein